VRLHRSLLLASSATVLLLLAACGGSSDAGGSDPTEARIEGVGMGAECRSRLHGAQ
jgi:hypothetical protein